MKRILVSLLLACFTAFCVANDIVRVSAVYEYVSNNPNETPAQAEKKAFEAAKLNDHKYIICDPTYIGAPIGATMPGMDNQIVKVIALTN